VIQSQFKTLNRPLEVSHDQKIASIAVGMHKRIQQQVRCFLRILRRYEFAGTMDSHIFSSRHAIPYIRVHQAVVDHMCEAGHRVGYIAFPRMHVKNVFTHLFGSRIDLFGKVPTRLSGGTEDKISDTARFFCSSHHVQCPKDIDIYTFGNSPFGKAWIPLCSCVKDDLWLMLAENLRQLPTV